MAAAIGRRRHHRRGFGLALADQKIPRHAREFAVVHFRTLCFRLSPTQSAGRLCRPFDLARRRRRPFVSHDLIRAPSSECVEPPLDPAKQRRAARIVLSLFDEVPLDSTRRRRIERLRWLERLRRLERLRHLERFRRLIRLVRATRWLPTLYGRRGAAANRNRERRFCRFGFFYNSR